MQDDLFAALEPAGFEDTLQFEDDELDTNPCMLPLVKLIEKAASLWRPGHGTCLADMLLSKLQWHMAGTRCLHCSETEMLIQQSAPLLLYTSLL